MRKIFGRIPPVGNPITIKTSNEIPVFPGSLKTYFLNSGTAALAAGLQIAQAHCKAKNPEVIIPAYCCPDLLSAILYNNMKPVLVDFIPDKPYMDLNGIEESLTHNTVAVIAVNFLGIPERFKEIKGLLDNKATLFIEDSAQWFPENEEQFSQHIGDLVVYSFGKGKPVCLLGGGALTVRQEDFPDPAVQNTAVLSKSRIAFDAVKYQAYNAIISPYAYFLLEHAPFISVGETRFHPLQSIEPASGRKIKYLYKNIQSYQTRSSQTQCNWRKSLAALNTCTATFLGDLCPTYQDERLLRFPLLFNNIDARNRFLSETLRAGLGTSCLYPTYLPAISGVPAGLFPKQELPNAKSFAQQIATLPVHKNVAARNIEHTIALLN